MKRMPSSERFQAWKASGSTDRPLSRCWKSPSRASSQPIPVAPGPYRSQNSAWSSTRAMCASSSRARPSGSAVSFTSIQLVCPLYSQVATKPWGGSQRSITPPALPSSW